MQGKEIGAGVKAGVLAGLVAWSCCISAIVLGFLGLGAAAAFFGSIQMKYHWQLVALAFICMDIAIYYILLHYHGACNIQTIRHNYGLIAFIILAALLIYFLLQAILPSLVTLSQPWN